MANRRSRSLLSLISASRKRRAQAGASSAPRRRLRIESLEDRRLLATNLLAVQANDGTLLENGQIRHVAPRELTFYFAGNATLNPSTVPGGFVFTSAGADDAFGTADDVVITPGFVGLDPNNGRQATVRFAEPLPDSRYRIDVLGAGPNRLLDTLGQPFNNGVNQSLTFELDLGPQVIAVVPQPVTRANAVLDQAESVVMVYFNDDDLSAASAQDPKFYRLVHLGDPINPNDDQILLPESVDYDSAANTARLDFGAALPNGLYHLRIGESQEAGASVASAIDAGTLFSNTTSFSNYEYLGDGQGGNDDVDDIDLYRFTLTAAGNVTINVHPDAGLNAGLQLFDAAGAAIPGAFAAPAGAGATATLVFNPGPGTYHVGVAGDGATTGSYRITITPPNGLSINDDNSSFGSATPLGRLGAASHQISSAITPQSFITLPIWPGGNDEPGHRRTPAENHLTFGPFTNFHTNPADNSPGVPTFFYTFDNLNPYGSDPNSGAPLFNQITPNQRQRAREIFELYSYYLGVQFVERPTAGGALWVITGDMRAISPSLPIGPGGVIGVSNGSMTGMVIMDVFDFQNEQALFGGTWQEVAFHEIGHSLGLGHSSDLSSNQAGTTGGLPGELIYRGDHDITHDQRRYRPDSTDIDLYRFEVAEPGRLKAETIAERLSDLGLNSSSLNSALRLYKTVYDPVSGLPVLDALGNELRELVAFNDDYFGNDSYLEIDVTAADLGADGKATFYLGVSSTGNTSYDPTISDTGFGGTTQGDYRLKLDFEPLPKAALVDATGNALDGNANGVAGGAYDFWFRVGATHFVDKTNNPTGGPDGDGSLANPYDQINTALAAAAPGDIVRIIGNGGFDGNVATTADNFPYLVGVDDNGSPLIDGDTVMVPRDVTLMIDAGVVIKMQAANIDAGSSSLVVTPGDPADRSRGAVQVLGTPDLRVIFTSYHNDAIGGNSDGLGILRRGDYGGIVFRADSDREAQGIFLNYVNHAHFTYGGGQVTVDSNDAVYQPVTMIGARPTVSHNIIERSADAAVAADPNSFDDRDGRIGPKIHGNRIFDNSINGLFIRINTSFGEPVDRLEVPGRWDDTDIVHVLTENLHIKGNPGGPIVDVGTGQRVARPDGRLRVDPGVTVKLNRSRIELEVGAQLIAEGTPEAPIVFTSLFDDRHGYGDVFDTNGDGATRQPAAGDWAGILVSHTASASIDRSLITFGGGNAPVVGGSSQFNVIEVHQGDLRLTNSVIERNASGQSTSTRPVVTPNTAATIFVRGAQPILVENIIRNNAAAAVSINVNAMQAAFMPDTGRSTGRAERYERFDDNHGPLVRLNRLASNAINGMQIRAEELVVKSVWDDTDIVHVVQGEIRNENHHTYSGLTLQSSATESLVVKFAAGAGLTAGGFPLDIDDRIGGTLHVLGTVGYPVVLTSLSDDSVGAGFTPDGRVQTNTNNSASPSAGAPGQWRGLLLDQYSNDRNVAVVRELESPYTDGRDINRRPAVDAQPLGTLARNETSGDENRRLGFDVHGFVSLNDPTDVDVYSFRAVPGTEVWLDLDQTGSSLDTVLELVTSANVVLASSLDNALSGTANPLSILKHNWTDPWLGIPAGDRDHYTLNSRDESMRVILPGSGTNEQTYFVRVRSRPAPGNETNLNGGLTSGPYQLQVRLRQTDELPGSTVRFADIRYATNALHVRGLPANSPLVSESGETSLGNNDRAGAQNLGNLLGSNRNAINVGGSVSAMGDVDFYRFSANELLLQSGGGSWATVFDIDYASSALGRADLTMAVFSSDGQLIMISRDSQIEDDQPAPGQGAHLNDLTRGSVNTTDPFIGTVQLPTGRDYYVAVSNNRQLPSALSQTFSGDSASTLTRLEPISSVKRVVEDHIGFQGYNSNGANIQPTTPGPLLNMSTAVSLSTHVTPFTLHDVQLYVASSGTLFSRSAFDGSANYTVGTLGGNDTQDLFMRSDGRLFSAESVAGAANNAGRLVEINPATGAETVIGNNAIPDYNATTNPANFEQLTSDVIDALAGSFNRDNPGNSLLYYSVRNAHRPLNPPNPTPPPSSEIVGGTSTLYRANPDNGSAAVVANQPWGRRGEIFDSVPGDLGITTGMAMIGGTLYGVNGSGQIYTINQSTGNATVLANHGVAFSGLTAGPPNVENGNYSNTLFAITTGGQLYAIDRFSGALRPIFAGGATSISTGVGGAQGLAFSPLDFNLWHPTMARSGDAGHGINPAFDNSRNPGGTSVNINGRSTNQGQGGASFYFGLENWVDPGNNNAYFRYGVNGQYGVLNEGLYRDLTTNPAIGGNYNLPGGAHGSLVSNSFSLQGYDAADKPTLYFNYYLHTQNANANSGAAMRDSARVFVSADDGATWTLVATNNSILSSAGTTNAELPSFKSVSRNAEPLNGNQRVQELYDSVAHPSGGGSSNGWRQARIDLHDFAGAANLKLRFDFSTAGTMNQGLPGDNFGNWNDVGRAQSNAFEGFYIDDIIVGFAERGEMVTGAPTNEAYFQTPGSNHPQAATEALTGAYQLEIRRGQEYIGGPFAPGALGMETDGARIIQTFDTNDRLVAGWSLLVPPGASITDGSTFTLSDGIRSIVYEFDTLGNGVAGTNRPVTIGGGATVGQVANAVTAAINATPNLDIIADTKAPGVNSNRVDLYGAANAFGSAVTANRFVLQGDQNFQRQQGQVILESNFISDASSYGINIEPAPRDAGGSLPFPGATMQYPVTNTDRLATGVVIQNNVLADNRTGGIRLSGDAGANPQASVPFARVLNNTIFGGSPQLGGSLGAATGTGILVENQSSPTIMNNIVAGLATGISVVNNAGRVVEIDSNLFQGNGANGPLGSNSQTPAIGAPLFVNASNSNYYLRSGSQAVDSSLNSLGERFNFTAYKASVGIGISNIVAPDRDVYGQLRVDSSGGSGGGSTVFKDRGAVDRSDFLGPYATLLDPLDNDADKVDQDPTPTVVELAEGLYTHFDILLGDGPNPLAAFQGTGINPATVTSQAVVLTRNGQPLIDGQDYTFAYNPSTNTIRLTAASGIWFPASAYVVTLANAIHPGAGGPITDLAGNALIPNQPDGRTRFTILMPGVLLDFGDAPDASVGAPYAFPTTKVNNGARHVIVDEIPLRLGSLVDPEQDGVPSAGANSDDTNTTIDVSGSPLALTVGNPFVLTAPGAGLSLHLPETFKLQVPLAGGSAIIDGQVFTIGDGVTSVTFEFDKNFTKNNPAHTAIALNDSSTTDDIANAIVTALDGAGLDLSPRNLGGGRVHVGSRANHTVNVAGAPSLALSGVAGSVAEGDTFVIDDGVSPVTFVFDDTLVGGVPAGDVVIPFTPQNTRTEIADAIAAAINAAAVGINAIPLGGGSVELAGSTTAHSLAITSAALAGAGSPGGVSDGDTFSINSGGRSFVFEFDRDGLIAPGHIAVPFGTASTASDVGASITAAISGSVAQRAVAVSNLGGGVVEITADDEDGVHWDIGLFIPSLGIGLESIINPSLVTTVRVVATGAGFLDAWIDFNRDGDWNDPGERIFASVPVVAGDNLLQFQAPSISVGGDAIARFRLSTTGGLEPTGVAVGGEVEDHLVQVVPGIPPTANNDPQSAFDPNYVAREDDLVLNVSAANGVLANDTDPDTPLANLTVIDADTATARGARITVNLDGSFIYEFDDGAGASMFETLREGEVITDTFTYRAYDGVLPSPTRATVTITIIGDNDLPVTQNVHIQATEDGPLVPGQFVGDDIDNDDNPASLIYTIVNNLPAGDGLVVNNNNTTFTFNPNANVDFQPLALGEQRNVYFTYRATDRHGANSDDPPQSLSTVTITVTGVNDTPVSQNVTINAVEDGPAVTGNFVADDIDSDDDPTTLIYTFVSGIPASEGTMINNGNGTFTFNPGPDFQNLALGETRTLLFGYRATDRHGAFAQSTVTVIVTGVNDTPVSQNVTINVVEDGPAVSGNFVADDIDSDDNPATLVYTFVSGMPASEGTMTNNGNGTFTFNPGADFQDLAPGETRTLLFGYRATDRHGAFAESTVTVIVTGVNDAPVSQNVTINVVEDGPAVTGNFVADDVDSDDDPTTLVYTFVSGMPASEGTMTNNGNGTFTFNPGADFQNLALGETRTLLFGYRATDRHGAFSESTVTVIVTGVNDTPTSQNVTINVVEDGPAVSGNFVANDIDSDDDPTTLVYTFVSGIPASEGTMTNNGNGTFTFNPGPDFQNLALNETRTLLFAYRATDRHGAFAQSTVTVIVTGVNDTPTSQNITINAVEDGPAVTGDFKLVSNDVDSDDDPASLTYAFVSGMPASEGTMTYNGDGTFTFNPGPDFQNLALNETRTLLFTYRATDRHGAFTESTVTVIVTGVNDNPTTGDIGGLTTTEDGPSVSADFKLVSDDIDSDDDPASLVYSITSGPLVFGTDTGGNPVAFGPGGVVTIHPDRTFTFDLNGDFEEMRVGEVRTVLFTYKATDRHGADSNISTVTITVTGVNDNPVVVNNTMTTTEDGPALASIPFPGSDIDNDDNQASLTYQILIGLGGNQGTLTNNGNATFTYNPGDDFHDMSVGDPARVVTFTYRALDRHGAVSNIGTITINVTAVNDRPVIENISLEAVEDGPPVQGRFEADDVDGDDTPQSLTYEIVTPLGPGEGSVTLLGGGDFLFDPGADFQDLDDGETRVVTFTYRALDRHGAVSVPTLATVTITVHGVNDAPVGVDDEYDTDEDTVLTVDAAEGLLANDTDAEPSDRLLVASASSTSAMGAAVLVDLNTGAFVYDPRGSLELQQLPAGQTAADTFTYFVSDGTATTGPVTVTIHVEGRNDAPVATDDGYDTDEDSVLTVAAAEGLLQNDTDIDSGAALSIQPFSLTTANGALVSVNADGSFSYDPTSSAIIQALPEGQTLVDSFTYQARDDQGAVSNTATVLIFVGGRREQPVANDDAYEASEDGVFSVAASEGVLVNDTDPENEPLTVVGFSATSAQGAIVNVAPDGSFTYNPTNVAAIQALNPGQTLTDTFTYVVSDGALTDVATVTLTIHGANDAPRAVNDGPGGAFVTDEDSVLTISAPGVLANDTDADAGAVLTVANSMTVSTLGARVTVNADGSFSYDPRRSPTLQALQPGQSRTDTFTYSITDGTATSNTATVSITVTGLSEPVPTANDDLYTADEDTVLSISAQQGVLENDEGGAVQVTTFSAVSAMGATVTVNPNGSFTYDPTGSAALQALAAGQTADDTFTYSITNGPFDSVEAATVTIRVTGVNDAPQAVNDAVTAEQGVPRQIAVLDNDVDVDGNLAPSTVQIVTGPAVGSAVANADGTITYTSPAAFTGLVTFTYTVADASGAVSNAATVTVNVTTGNSPGYNERNPYDVDDNGMVNAADALAVIIALRNNGSGAFPIPANHVGPPFWDVSNDGLISLLDVVEVIQEMNRILQQASGEGEPHADADLAGASPESVWLGQPIEARASDSAPSQRQESQGPAAPIAAARQLPAADSVDQAFAGLGDDLLDELVSDELVKDLAGQADDEDDLFSLWQ